MPIAITPVEYGGLQEAYDHFNAALFDGGLPDVFITYKRKANSRGYFSPDRFSGRGIEFGKHELALNPDGFIGQSDEAICSTLVHEQAHVWQQAYGDLEQYPALAERAVTALVPRWAPDRDRFDG